MNKERLIVAALAAVLLLPLLAAAPRATGGLSPAQAAPAPQDIDGLVSRPDLPVDSPDDEHAGPRTAAGGMKIQGGARVETMASCDKDINPRGRKYRLVFVKAVNNTVCQSSDLSAYSTDTRHYVVQGGWYRAAYTHYDVTTPWEARIVRQFRWSGTGAGYTRTMSSKTFRQGSRRYLALALERDSGAGYCGIVLMDVTNPAYPAKKAQYIGANWCDTHNVFVENDRLGNGRYIWATANYTKDMRVLDISGAHGGTIARPKEIGRYKAPTADATGSGYGTNWVHDIVVADHGGTTGRRAYLSYWYSGAVILDADRVTPGYNPAPIVGPGRIDPSGFRTHHAVPNAAGTRLFIQDEFLLSSTARPVQMWDIGGIPTRAPRYVAGLRQNVGVNGRLHYAHNLTVIDNKLFVGWYTAGLQAWIFRDDGFSTRHRYHQVQTESSDGGWDGTWGVDTLMINGRRHYFQADMNYGLIISREE
jgi:hypothetical protein